MQLATHFGSFLLIDFRELEFIVVEKHLEPGLTSRWILEVFSQSASNSCLFNWMVELSGGFAKSNKLSDQITGYKMKPPMSFYFLNQVRLGFPKYEYLTFSLATVFF